VEIVDAQVHIWERDHPGRPWVAPPSSEPERSTHELHLQTFRAQEMTASRMLERMDEVGVAAAIAVPAPMVYSDGDYIFESVATSPDRLAAVTYLDPTAPNVEELVSEWGERPGGLGFRLRTTSDFADIIRSGAADRGFRAIEGAGASVDVGLPALASLIASTHPDLQVVVSHLGLGSEADPTWSALPGVLAAAEFPNIALKATAVPVHSAEPYPFRDVWAPLMKVIEAFGVERVMWGSDWTRVTTLTYREGLDYISEIPDLSQDERELLLGKNLRRIFRWEPAPREH
jgi:predicted TIM-barrel fold metal-dependent hydrolase